jgi:hypothetical protein
MRFAPQDRTSSSIASHERPRGMARELPPLITEQIVDFLKAALAEDPH